MRMDLLPLNPPVPFLQSPGEPPIAFTTWIHMFETYLLAISATEISEVRKRTLLIHCLGAEGQHIFYTFPLADDKYETALTALKNFFVPKVNVVANCYRFHQSGQKPGETIMQYIASLRSLIVICDFGNMADEMIRDQLIEKTTMLHVRERLLLEPQLTLEKAITIGTQIESATAEAKIMSMNKGGTVPAVTLLQKSSLPLQTHNCKRKTNEKPSNQQIQNTVKACFCCGSPQHLANYTGCLVKVAQCNHCKKIGYFAKVCRSSQFNEQVHAVTIPDVTVLSLDKITTAHIPEQIKCTVNVSALPSGKQHSIQLMLDTGSAVSILPDSIYLHYFKDVPLTEPKLHLVSYLKNHIPVHGCLPIIVTFGDCCVTAELYIVHKGTPILGRDLLAALNLRVVNGRIDLPQQSTLAVHTPVSAGTQHQIEEKLGYAYGFLHIVKMRNNVMPVRQRLRWLPFSVREAVSEELRKLVQKDIIEEIDSSEWVSPIVVMQKKSGGIRLCVDLREPNQASVIDSHPLPHIEVFAELCGAKMFSTLDFHTTRLCCMKISETSQHLLHEGLFHFKHVSYGLASAPSAFQKMM
ncbi:unnamed protein product [Lepidochelys kempii]